MVARLLALPAAEPAPADSLPVTDIVDVITIILVVVAAAAAALVVAIIVHAIVASIGKRWPLVALLSRRSRQSVRALFVLVGVWISLYAVTEAAQWRSVVGQVLSILLVWVVAWVVGSLALAFEDAALQRYRIDVPDNAHARRVRTQVQLLRRLTVAALVVGAIGASLMTLPGARTLGASIFASAGVVSIVAGLAAQSSLANVFAGIQLAFTDAIRVQDVVIVQGEFGRVEEITLTYVVVHVWDDRRIILPSTYFTTTPFENWTRQASDLLGTVEMDVDWQVPVEPMRAELMRLVQSTELWDGRVAGLQVTGAVEGRVRVRALASAKDAPTLWDLRCFLREGLVAWVQEVAQEAIPRSRWKEATVGAGAGADLPHSPVDGAAGSRTFSGPGSSGKAAEFTGPGRPEAAADGDAAVRPDEGEQDQLGEQDLLGKQDRPAEQDQQAQTMQLRRRDILDVLPGNPPQQPPVA